MPDVHYILAKKGRFQPNQADRPGAAARPMESESHRIEPFALLSICFQQIMFRGAGFFTE